MQSFCLKLFAHGLAHNCLLLDTVLAAPRGSYATISAFGVNLTIDGLIGLTGCDGLVTKQL